MEESTGKDFLDGEKGETRLPFKSLFNILLADLEKETEK